VWKLQILSAFMPFWNNSRLEASVMMNARKEYPTKSHALCISESVAVILLFIRVFNKRLKSVLLGQHHGGQRLFSLKNEVNTFLIAVRRCAAM